MTRFVSFLLMPLLFVAVLTAYSQTETATQDTPATSQTEETPKFAPFFQLEIKDQAVSEMFRGLKVTKRFQRRLPNFYNQVISDVQTDKVYEIQSAYFEPIEMLTLRLERLTAERNAQIEAVLTDEQMTKVEALRKDSAARSAATRAANRATNANTN